MGRPDPTLTLPYLAGLAVYAATVAAFSAAIAIRPARAPVPDLAPLVFATSTSAPERALLIELLRPLLECGDLSPLSFDVRVPFHVTRPPVHSTPTQQP